MRGDLRFLCLWFVGLFMPEDRDDYYDGWHAVANS